MSSRTLSALAPSTDPVRWDHTLQTNSTSRARLHSPTHHLCSKACSRSDATSFITLRLFIFFVLCLVFVSVQFVLNNVECFKLIFTAITIDIELIGPDEHLKAFLATSNDLIILKKKIRFRSHLCKQRARHRSPLVRRKRRTRRCTVRTVA